MAACRMAELAPDTWVSEEDDTPAPLSALQHLADCPRQCALIHLEQAWAENLWTAESRVLHERVSALPRPVIPPCRITRARKTEQV